MKYAGTVLKSLIVIIKLKTKYLQSSILVC